MLGILGIFLFHRRDYISSHYILRPGLFAEVAGLTVLVLFLRARANQLLFRRLGVDATLWNWFGAVSVTAFLNYLPFSAGMFGKALYLKRFHSVPYRVFAVGQFSLLLIVTAANGSTGLVALAMAYPASLFGVLGVGFLGMIVAIGVLYLPESTATKYASRWFPNVGTILRGVRRAWPAALCARSRASS